MYTTWVQGETYGQALYRLDSSQAVLLLCSSKKMVPGSVSVSSIDTALHSETSISSARGWFKCSAIQDIYNLLTPSKIIPKWFYRVNCYSKVAFLSLPKMKQMFKSYSWHSFKTHKTNKCPFFTLSCIFQM